MARSAKDSNSPEHPEGVSKSRRYRFELSRLQLSLCCFGLIAALSWMFVFGLLVARGIPLVDPSDISFHAVFMRFLGLGRQTPPPPQNVAETWEDQKKMLESLNYYEDLTRSTTSSGSKTPSPITAAPDPAPKKIPGEQPDQRQKQLPQPPHEAAMDSPGPPPAARQTPPHATPDPFPPQDSSEHYTLLISSLKDSENAQRMVEQLKAKGYPTRIEMLDLSGSRWNRVLVGSFQNRGEALRFAAEFNRKEKMEGLVIRESR